MCDAECAAMASRSRRTTTHQNNADLSPDGHGPAAKKKTRTKQRRGKLPDHLKKQKIHVEPLGLWMGGLTHDEIVRQIYLQADKKLEDLMDHYKIPLHSPERLWLLSFYLARDMGLMNIAFGPPPRGRGRPRKWKNTGNGAVANKRISEKVDRRRSGKNPGVAILSKKAAAEHLINTHPEEYGNLTSKSLVNRAGEANRPKAQTPGEPLHLAARRLLQSPPGK
jgi:hypothetical protein